MPRAVPVEDEAYKRLREAFVSDHYGSTLWDINQVTLIAPVAVLLWSILQIRMRAFDPYSPLMYLADFLIQGVSVLCAVTVYADQPAVLNSLFLLPALSIYLNQKSAEDQPKKQKKPPASEGAADKPKDLALIDSVPVKPFVTHYRGAMMIITCVCILAVDFPVFPRRFAKTESLGTSLMDLGVGSFVFAAGVVSVRQQLKEESGDASPSNFLNRFIGSFRHALPLVALGLIRLYFVKKLNYAEHVTEYGVHWNFFFTLAGIPPFVAIFQTLFNFVPSYAIIGYTISLVQQMLLVYTDLLEWLAFAPRDNFWAANKEGVTSLPGYLAIFLVGQAVGMDILQRDQSPDAVDAENDLWLAETLGGEDKVKEMKKSHRRFAWINLAKWSAIWCVVYYFTTGAYGPRLVVSRRYANMAYFVWVCAFNSVQLWAFCSIEMLFFPAIYSARHKHVEDRRVKQATSAILGAFNKNGLAIFLLANVLTGAINMSIKTIDISDIPAMAVLTGYLAVLTIVALALDKYNINIKL